MEETVLELHEGDCVEGMRELPDASVDLVVTSPPYNLGIQYGKYKDQLTLEDYLEWTRTWAGEVRRLLKPEGSFFLNIGAAPANPLLPHQVLLALTEEQFVLQNTFHWIKSITVETRAGEEISAGHFKPINSGRFVNDCHEYVFHLTADGKVPVNRREVGVSYADKSNIGRWEHTGGKDRRCRGNNWFIPYQTISRRAKDRPHPATFPAELAEMCIRLVRRPREAMTMLDPFLGIGHAGQAAQRQEVERFIGFEIDPDYLVEARNRMGLVTEDLFDWRPSTIQD